MEVEAAQGELARVVAIILIYAVVMPSADPDERKAASTSARRANPLNELVRQGFRI